MRMILSLVLVLALLLSGCGAILQGTSQSISVQSNPNGAVVLGYTTPAVIKLSRGQSHHLVFSKEGYKDAHFDIHTRVGAGWIILDIVCGVVGVAIDAATGGWNSLYPDVATVTLEKIEGAMVPGPDKIEVYLSCNDEMLDLESAHPVKVTIDASD